MNKDLLTFLETRLHGILKDAIDANEVSGASLLIAKDGQTLFHINEGYADLASVTPICPDTIFHLFSMTKPITAAAALLLMERGLLDLGTPVAQFLPGFLNQRALLSPDAPDTTPVRRPVMVKDLLSMTSGLPYGDPSSAATRAADDIFRELDQRLWTDDPMTTQELANRLGQAPLEFQPGERWLYGTSADVLGAIIEIVSGRSLRNFMKEELFDPLGMNDTDFFVPTEKQNRLAKYYQSSANGLVEEPIDFLGIQYCPTKIPAFQSGGAGLLSTAKDYARFANMLHGEGSLDGKKILSPHTVRFFLKPSLTPSQRETMAASKPHWNGYSYGNLMRFAVDPGQAVWNVAPGEYGWYGWTGPVMSNIPEHKLTLLYMIQKPGASITPTARKLFNAACAVLLP